MLYGITIIWLLINVLFFLWLATSTLGNYQAIADLIGFKLTNATAKMDFMATYGGLQLITGLVIGYFLVTKQYALGLKVVALLALGYGGGRLYAMIYFGDFNDPTSIMYLGIEIAALILSLALLKLN